MTVSVERPRGTEVIHPTRDPSRFERNQTTGTNASGRATLMKSSEAIDYPLRRLSFRRSIVPLSLNATSIKANPTVASIAAAAIEKKTMFQPVRIGGFEYRVNATRLMFAALTISSTENSMRIAFLFETRP